MSERGVTAVAACVILAACSPQPEVVHVQVAPEGRSAPQEPATSRYAQAPPRASAHPAWTTPRPDDDEDFEPKGRRAPPPPPLPPAACPPSRADVFVGAACGGCTTCSYGRSTCTCAPQQLCQGIARRHDGPPVPNAWSCKDPRTDGCPDEQPAEGTPCVRARSCTYAPCGGHVLGCVQGRWKVTRKIAPPG